MCLSSVGIVDRCAIRNQESSHGRPQSIMIESGDGPRGAWSLRITVTGCYLFSVTSWSLIVIFIIQSPWHRVRDSGQGGEDTEIESTVRYLSRITKLVVDSFFMGFASFTMSMAIVIDIVDDSIMTGDFIVDGTVWWHVSLLVALCCRTKPAEVSSLLGGSFTQWRSLHVMFSHIMEMGKRLSKAAGIINYTRTNASVNLMSWGGEH